MSPTVGGVTRQGRSVQLHLVRGRDPRLMTVDTAQISDQVRVDQAAELDLFEIDRITRRRTFESVCGQAASSFEQLG